MSAANKPNVTAYEALKALGHSPAKAAEIVLDANRGDKYARDWVQHALARATDGEHA